MTRDSIQQLIVGKVQRAFDEADAQKAVSLPVSNNPEDVVARELRARLDTRIGEWDRAIEEAIRLGKERLLLMRTGGKTWFEKSTRFRRGARRHSSQGAKFNPLLEGLEIDTTVHGLRRLRNDRLLILSEWLEEKYWHAVWVEHYHRNDHGVSWKHGEISDVREICEELLLTWI